MRNERHGNSDIAGFVDTLLRHVWWFVLPLVVGLVAVIVVGMQMPTKYNGSALVDLKTNAVMTKMMRESLVPDYEVRKDSISDMVVGEGPLDRVMEDLHVWVEESPNKPKVKLDALRDVLKRKVIVSHRLLDSNHDRIEISLTHDNPEVVRRVVNLLARTFIDNAKLEIDEEIKRAQSFFDDELTRSRIAFEEIDNERLAFELKHSDVLNTDAATLRAMMAATADRRNSLNFKLNSATQWVQELRARLETTPDKLTVTVKISDPELAAIEDDLRSLRLLLAKSVGELQMREKHPDVIALRRSIAATEVARESILASLETEKQEPNPEKPRVAAALAEAERELELLRKEEPDFEGKIADLNRRLAAMLPVRSELRDFAGKVEAARRQMEFWEENNRRTQLMMVTEYADAGVQLNLSRPCPELVHPMPHDLLPLIAAAVIISVTLGVLGLRVGMLVFNWSRIEDDEPQAAQEPYESIEFDDEAYPPGKDPRASLFAQWRRIAAPAAFVIAVGLLLVMWMFFSGRGPAPATATPGNKPGAVEPMKSPSDSAIPSAPADAQPDGKD